MCFMTASAVKYRTEITNPKKTKKKTEIRKCFETGFRIRPLGGAAVAFAQPW